MADDLKSRLSHVLWIGGATDAGKTTTAQIIAERHGLQLYNYDRRDVAHTTRLAETLDHYRRFLAASLDENWVQPEPEDLVRRSFQSFQDRFPMVVEDLLALPPEPMVVAEGFGFTPELLHPVLSSPRQAIWLVPTEEFKWASMQRRGKPSFSRATSDAGRATRNLFTRDMLLAEHLKAQAGLVGGVVVEVDGSRSIDEMVALIERHFEPLLSSATVEEYAPRG